MYFLEAVVEPLRLLPGRTRLYILVLALIRSEVVKAVIGGGLHLFVGMNADCWVGIIRRCVVGAVAVIGRGDPHFHGCGHQCVSSFPLQVDAWYCAEHPVFCWVFGGPHTAVHPL